MNKVTGNEPYYPITESSSNSATLYQVALKDFMCALVHRTSWDAREIATRADELTQAYINQLNKNQ